MKRPHPALSQVAAAESTAAVRLYQRQKIVDVHPGTPMPGILPPEYPLPKTGDSLDDGRNPPASSHHVGISS